MDRLRHIDNTVDWRRLTAAFRDHNYQQTAPYAEAIARRQRARCERLSIESDTGELLGAAAVRVRRVPILGCGIAYIANGPLCRREDDVDGEQLGRCVAVLRRHYLARGLTLRILAPIGTPSDNLRTTDALALAGLTPTGRSRRYRTMLLDLRRPLDEIQCACSKYWRRNLRRADRSGSDVVCDTDGSSFEQIIDLCDRLHRRKTFRTELDARFYASLLGDMAPEERFTVAVARRNGRIGAGLVASRLGDTCVPLLFASDPDSLLAYDGYALQWHSIRKAHERGLGTYDLGGIDPDCNPGVYNFKQGLRGTDVTLSPYQAEPPGSSAAVTRLLESVQRRLKRHLTGAGGRRRAVGSSRITASS